MAITTIDNINDFDRFENYLQSDLVIEACRLAKYYAHIVLQKITLSQNTHFSVGEENKVVDLLDAMIADVLHEDKER